ncbi:MAG: DUF5706 domain-containing protein [Gemmatimonadales bacterium]
MTTTVESIERAPELSETMQAVLGGAPLPKPLSDDLGDKARRRVKKRQARQLRDASRPPTSFERWRMLIEVAKEARQVIDLADHKARYALIILGALNAAVFFILARGHYFAELPVGVKPWLIGFLVIYATLTFVFVLYAIDCIRPRQLHRLEPSQEHEPRGLLYWETIALYQPEAYRRAWGEVRLAELNAEAVVIIHRLSVLIQQKYRAMGRLFAGLVAMVVLAMVLLTSFAIFAILE